MTTKLESFAIIGGGKKENRVENDVYPTPPECTIALMEFMNKNIYPLTAGKKLKVWEPACDIGGMSKVIESYGHFVTSTDLRHTGYGEGGIDFLTTNEMTCDAIITNPPFNLSQDFIEKSLKIADIVCMVLKSQYWHAAKRQKLFNDYTPAFICPMTWRPDFSGSPTMDCIWTIWVSGDHDAKYYPLLKPAQKPAKPEPSYNPIQLSII